jgi:hypothetical protein
LPDASRARLKKEQSLGILIQIGESVLSKRDVLAMDEAKFVMQKTSRETGESSSYDKSKQRLTQRAPDPRKITGAGVAGLPSVRTACAFSETLHGFEFYPFRRRL